MASFTSSVVLGVWGLGALGIAVLVLALPGIFATVRARRVAKARRAGLSPGEHELGLYDVRRPDGGSASLFGRTRCLRTTNHAVEYWHGSARLWRRPWTELAFAEGTGKDTGALVLTSAAPAAEALRVRLLPPASPGELLLAARRMGATVREEEGSAGAAG
ncbi:hypothetical protein [Streptomyces sp. SID11385]|uniref:hypothetical protein n=1 Tax=Streptomyces sp. SID11385 TaxID=2706031 RepID=UPI0013C5F649|nr:hypothetical protein [Streptomyces sp. SID11385]NEA40826.1 hypothetical protein [Streptomyces sp. SID11385]